MKTLLTAFALLLTLTAAGPAADPTYKYDLIVRLAKVECKRVVEGPMDNEEDLLIDARSHMANRGATRSNHYAASNFQIGRGTRSIGQDVLEMNNLTYSQLINTQIYLRAGVSDTEAGGVIKIPYTMVEGDESNYSRTPTTMYGRVFRISEWNSTFNHLKTLAPASNLVTLKIGADTYAETNFYEKIGSKSSSSHVVLYWQLLVKVKNA